MNISSFSNYQDFVAAEIEQELKRLNFENLTIQEIKDKNPLLLAAPDIETKNLEITPLVFDRESMPTQAAIEAILTGKVFWEHTAAGEATRLGLGTKYQLNRNILQEAFSSQPNLKENFDDQQAALRNTLTLSERQQAYQLLNEVQNLSLGIRHLLQQIIDIQEIAEKQNYDPQVALQNQSNLLILNETTAEKILAELINLEFLGLDPKKTFFMIQKSGYGFNLQNGKVVLDKTSPKRLYNHGGMRLQTAMEQEIFYFLDNKKQYLSSTQYQQVLAEKKIMLSINIEDLDWLENSIDLPACALGLKLGQQGFEMIMTAVKQKVPAQKGGFFCQINGKTVCIETDADPQMFNDDPQVLNKIKYLNKNMNYYPNPAMMIKKMREYKLPLHPTVKGAAIYPQTPQGDLNFILKTQVIQEKQPKAIRNLKTQKDILETLKQFKRQDQKNEIFKYLEKIIPNYQKFVV